MQAETGKGPVRYKHVTDLLVNGKGTKKHQVHADTQPIYTFEIEEVMVKSENILHLLEEANGLQGIKAACMHHVKHVSFGQRADYRMSYLPLKKAI